jgi:uncharacterized PurR-regulated membrane protein YhhQ (DUF165 family)
VSAYEAGVSAGRRGAIRFAADVADFGSRGLRNPTEMIGRAHVANLSKRKGPGVLVRTLGALLRLVLPVAFLLTAGAACLIYSDLPAEGLGTFAGKPISLGAALLPFTFFVVHLTNRRYGAAYALAQVVMAWLLGLLALPSFIPMLPSAPDVRVVAGFGTGLFVAQLAAIILFDRLRGPTWWKAPLLSSLLAGIVLCLIAFPAAFAGTGRTWSPEMVNFLELATAAAVLMLVPYGLLRSLVPPRPGFGGY